ncbi:hypothetical protein [Ralstonia pseudosolanacearum]
MNRHHFALAALMLALLSPAARADLGEMKQDIKQGSKDAAKKTGHAAREFGHATANAAKTVGHGVANAAHETKRATKRLFHKSDSE